MSDEDLKVEVKDTEGNVVLTLDFNPHRPDIEAYAKRFGLSLREAAECAVGMLVENLNLDPEATVDHLVNTNPFHYHFRFQDGSGGEVDLTDYSEEILKRARDEKLPFSTACKKVLLANIEVLRPTIRWTDSEEK